MEVDENEVDGVIDTENESEDDGDEVEEGETEVVAVGVVKDINEGVAE